jgi:hypothetical protein
MEIEQTNTNNPKAHINPQLWKPLEVQPINFSAISQNQTKQFPNPQTVRPISNGIHFLILNWGRENYY